MSTYREQNQICEAHPLCFTPLYQTISNDPQHDPSQEGMDSMYYVPTAHGVRILENGDVEFCFDAPNAHTVEVAGIGGKMGTEKHPLTRCEDGLWRAVISGIEPGFHLHKYYVDGVQLINRMAPIGYGNFAPNNFFEKTEADSEIFFLKDVPHGSVHMDLYRSSVTGRLKCCYVYTPPGYDNSGRSYPVLYLQHGATENEIGWIWHGKANFILDNLLSENKCEEMIIVINCGYGFVGDESPVFLPGDFDRELAEDCIPYIDKKYRTLTDRTNRAVCGLSLGSGQAFYAALKHRDLFASLGMFSGGVPFARAEYDYTDFFNDPDQVNSNFRLFYVSAGQQEFWCQNGQEVCNDLADRGIKTEFFSCPGYHEWDVWRYSLCDFVQKLFK